MRLPSCCMLWLGLMVCQTAAAAERQATPAAAITVHSGFQVELLRSAQPGEGSWISMTFDAAGRIILSKDQAGLMRLTLGSSPDASTIEELAETNHLAHCRGVLFAHDSLYACATNGEGIYRLRDLDRNGTYEEAKLLVKLQYNSRYGHGANQLTLGPDGMIYVAIGNDVRFPETRDLQSPYRQSQNDWLLPNPRDGDQDDRVGYILKMDPEGTKQTILCGGLRNQVDVAFNRDGELFTWDADMEWDVGLPWYRPTRINHLVSAGEYGWRWGTGKRPAWFPDTLPSTLDTGLGSPTGIVFGSSSHWPERYRQALYAADWQNGRLLLIDMEAQGASYQARAEVFAEGSPLNICDMQFGPDGALYFITGGRGSQSGLYRITQKDQGPPADALARIPQLSADALAQAAAAREQRRSLENFHVTQDSAALPLIWKSLGSDDIWIRYAARLALENQPVSTWRKLVATEQDSKTRHTALMALARVGETGDQKIVLKGLKDWDFSLTDSDELLWGLRTLQLTLIRQGPPGDDDRRLFGRRLARLPMTDHFEVTWLRCELLVSLKTPDAVADVCTQLLRAQTQEEQIQLVKTLLRADQGWTPETRGVVLEWLQNNRQLAGGKLVKAVLQGMREDFEQMLNSEERERLQVELEQLRQPPGEKEITVSQTLRPFVKNWTVDELDEALATIETEPAVWEEGRKLASAALCLRCHQIGGRGGQVGPDLTTVGKRMNRRTLLDSILDPSKEIDPKYNNSTYVLENGHVISGRTTMVNRDQIGVETDPLTGSSVVIPRAEISESRTSLTSPMPQGLLNTLTVADVRNLIAYLQSAGVSPNQ